MSPSDTMLAAFEAIQPRIPSLQQLVLQALYDAPEGLTDDELEVLSGKQRVTIAPRRNELYEMGFIADSGKRRMSRYGAEEIVWVWLPTPVEASGYVNLLLLYRCSVCGQHRPDPNPWYQQEDIPVPVAKALWDRRGKVSLMCRGCRTDTTHQLDRNASRWECYD